MLPKKISLSPFKKFDKILKSPNPDIKQGSSTIPQYNYGLGVSINKSELKYI